MRRRIAWLTAPDPLDDQLDAERVVHGPADGPGVHIIVEPLS